MTKEQLEKWYMRIWREGKYVDLWSLNHTLIGAVLAGFFEIVGVPVIISLIISTLVIVGWEFWEVFKKISEAFWNKIIDVVTGILGFLGMHYLLGVSSHELILFLIVLAVYLVLEVWGYWVYKKKGVYFI